MKEEEKKKKLKIARQRRIFKKNYENYDKLSNDMKQVIFQMEDIELEHLIFCLNFNDHIDAYIKDCLKSLREYKRKVVQSL